MTGQWIEVFMQRRDASDIHWRIILQTAGRVSLQSEGPTTAKAQHWHNEVCDPGTIRSNRSAKWSGWEERQRVACTSVHRDILVLRPCWDSEKKQDFVYSGSQNWEPAQIIDHMSAYVRVWWQKSNQPGCSIQNRLLWGVRTLRSLHKVDYPTLCCISRKTRTPR